MSNSRNFRIPGNFRMPGVLGLAWLCARGSLLCQGGLHARPVLHPLPFPQLSPFLFFMGPPKHAQKDPRVSSTQKAEAAVLGAGAGRRGRWERREGKRRG